MTEPLLPARERVVSSFEHGYLLELVEQTRGNMSKAARLAGVDRSTLYRLLQKHGITSPRQRKD